MVFFARKKKSESQKLLHRPKGFFGRRRDEEISFAIEKKRAGTKRGARLFSGKDEGALLGTAPSTPSSPLNITVVTTPPSPARLQSAKDDQDISELTYSVIRSPDSQPVYSSSLINDATLSPMPKDQPPEHASPKQDVVVKEMAGEPTAESTTPISACPSDATSDVVTKILGMMDEACTSTDRNSKMQDNMGPGGSASSSTSRRSDLASVMSSVFSGVLTRPSTTAGESSSSSAMDRPTWGVAPTQTEDEDLTLSPDTREAVEDSLQKSRGSEVAPSTRDAAAHAGITIADTAPAISEDDNRHRDEHEDFELVLGRQSKEPISQKRRNWLHRGREFQEEKKDDDLAAKNARYRAVFGAEPEESPKKNILPAFVKRLSLAGKQNRRDTKPEPTPPAVVTPNASTRSLRPGLEMEESLRGVHYLEDEPDHEEEIKLEQPAPVVVSPEIQKVDDGPLAVNESKRSRSWNQALQGILGGGNEEPSVEVDTPAPSIPRTRSSPMRLLGFGGPLKPPKPTWKSAVDPTTGVPYYYHRLTRQTTWSKPKDFDKQRELWENYQQHKKNSTQKPDDVQDQKVDVPSNQKADLPAVQQKSTDKQNNNIEVSSILRKKSPRDFNPDVWQSKQQIVRLLTIMNPPNPESVEKLIKQYEGREEELLAALEELVESQPFDEPMQTESSLASSEVVEEIASGPEPTSEEGYNRIRTEATATSGFLSQKTDQTEKHRNTAAQDSTPPANAKRASLSTSTSFSSNLESQEELNREEPSPSKKNVVINYQGNNRLKHSAVPRDRELVVEEFTTSRLKKENYDLGSRTPNKRMSHVQTSRDETESSYNGDNDETDDGETFGEDSISALSEVEGDFQRREQIDLARQRLVQETKDNTLKSARIQPNEWKQSELDKFISENGWDAVASYVSRMRDANGAVVERSSKVSQVASRPNGGRQESNKMVARSEPASGSSNDQPSPRVHHPPYAQRKFGARSQLQHSNLGDDSSWESESSYDSDDYTETSYESDDDPSSLTNSKSHRKEFVC